MTNEEILDVVRRCDIKKDMKSYLTELITSTESSELPSAV